MYTKLVQIINLQFPKKTELATIIIAKLNLNTHELLVVIKLIFFEIYKFFKQLFLNFANEITTYLS